MGDGQARPSTPRTGPRGATVPDGWVSDRQVRHLISNGYLSLESSEAAAAVAIPLRPGLPTIDVELVFEAASGSMPGPAIGRSCRVLQLSLKD